MVVRLKLLPSNKPIMYCYGSGRVYKCPRGYQRM